MSAAEWRQRRKLAGKRAALPQRNRVADSARSPLSCRCPSAPPPAAATDKGASVRVAYMKVQMGSNNSPRAQPPPCYRGCAESASTAPGTARDILQMSRPGKADSAP